METEKGISHYRYGIRNLGIIAHIDAGKTSLTERLLERTGAIRRAGEVSEGTTVTDWLLQERERGISIVSACVTCSWDGVQVNIVDTPGHVDFTAEVERSLRVMDGVVAVFCGVSGVQAQSETVWRQACRNHLPVVGFVNKLDREGADFEKVCEDVEKRFGIHAVPVGVPMMRDGQLVGVADVITGQVLDEKDGSVLEDVSEDAAVWYAREQLLEVLTSYDDGILEARINDCEPTAEALRRAVRGAVTRREIMPVFAGSCRLGMGMRLLLNGICDYLPMPEERLEETQKAADGTTAFVFKVQNEVGCGLEVVTRIYHGSVSAGDDLVNTRTGETVRVGAVGRLSGGIWEPVERGDEGDIVVLCEVQGTVVTGDTLSDCPERSSLDRIEFPEPVVSMAMTSLSSGDSHLVREALMRLCSEDPTLQVREDVVGGQWMLQGMGELHLEIIRERLLSDYGVNVQFGKPMVNYRKTIQRLGHGSCQFEKRLVSGDVQRAGVSVTLQPLEQGQGVTFVLGEEARAADEASVELAEAIIRRVMHNGLDEDGWPLTDMALTLESVSTFSGETTEIALQVACVRALEQALAEGTPIQLEPLMKVEVSVPRDYVGRVLSDIVSRRGRITGGTELPDGTSCVISQVPLGELFGYANSLRSLSCGRGEFSAEPSVYAPVRAGCTEEAKN